MEQHGIFRMTTFPREITPWQLRSRTLELGRRTLVMGIVNLTPDSFSDGGAFLDPESAVAHALELLDEGADILDLGAESTRPGSRAGSSAASGFAPRVSAEQEQARLLPVLEGILRARPQAVVSIDTYKAATARAALRAGAEIVNDVSGFTWDEEMAAVCARAGCGVVLMHTRGRPDEWSAQPPIAFGELLAAVRDGLAASLRLATAEGIPPETTRCWPGRRSCWRWEGRSWPGSAGNLFWRGRWRHSMETTTRRLRRARRPAWRPRSRPSCMEPPSCASTLCARPSRQPASPTRCWRLRL
jgi:dihydropteroate synthase